MVVEQRPSSVTDEMIKYWDSNEIMKEFKAVQVESGTTPDIEEAVRNLKFLLTFSVGYQKMGFEKMSEKYSNAATIYIRFLREMGYQSSLGMGQRTKSSISGSLDNIVRQATFGIIRDEDCY